MLFNWKSNPGIILRIRYILICCGLSGIFQANAQPVKVAAAANLRYVFNEIKLAYEKENPSVTIIVNFGSSGAFVQQILNGASFDVFMAADNVFAEKLKESGHAIGEIKTYALGKLGLWSNSIDVSGGTDVLKSGAVKRIAIAKPDLAPYGERAVTFLKSSGLYEPLKDKIIYADNISQAAQFALTGNADVAFLALSLTLTPEMKGSVYEISPGFYLPIEQSVVLLKNAEKNPEAAKFMEFVLSDKCTPIFRKNGYAVKK